MSLEIWFHPLAIGSQVAALALFESGADFLTHALEEVPESQRQAFLQRWPSAQTPVLIDGTWDECFFGASIIAEYVTVYGQAAHLKLAEAGDASESRRWGRLLSRGIARPMQVFCDQKLGLPNPRMVGEVEAQRWRRLLDETLPIFEERLGDRPWLMGESFSLVDCQAAPTLLACEAQQELRDYPNLRAYLDRCWERPAFLQLLRLVDDRFLRYGEKAIPLILRLQKAQGPVNK